MPWCPKCRDEYREGFRRCATCGSILTAEMPRERETPEADAGKPVLLTWSDERYKLQMMDGALRDAGIPFYYVERGLGSSYSPNMNVTTGGVEIYVPEKLLERARDTIAVFDDGRMEVQARRQAGIPDEEMIKRKRRRSIITACIFMFVVVPGAILLILWRAGFI